jgi:hypothetical protein
VTVVRNDWVEKTNLSPFPRKGTPFFENFPAPESGSKRKGGREEPPSLPRAAECAAPVSGYGAFDDLPSMIVFQEPSSPTDSHLNQ